VRLAYRREIDGLRAVAVVPVVLFHAGAPWFRGGFVGVDVFFVISGYLITSLILAEERAGRFSSADFYERRARRLLPALFIVILACTPFAWFWMTPSGLNTFGEGLAAVGVFLSNVWLSRQNPYFAPLQNQNPLLHTWSLSVEEQYYLVFPLVAVWCWRFGRTWLTAAVVLAVALLSLAVAQFGLQFSPHAPFLQTNIAFVGTSLGFYRTTARAWELMAGTLIAVLPQGANGRSWLRDAGAGAGMTAILFAVATFDNATPYPGAFTLVPVMGTVLVIVCATSGTLVARALSGRVLVALGLTSYSLYLWHQPVLAFARARASAEPRPMIRAILVAASLGLAYLTWRYVERPFRDRRRFSRAQIFAMAAVAQGCVIAGAVVLMVTDGGLNRFPEQDRYLLGLDAVAEGRFVGGRVSDLNRDFTPATTTRRKLLVIGDSFAQDFVNAIFENQFLSDYQIRLLTTSTTCQIRLPVPDSPECHAYDLTRDTPQRRIRQADVIVLAANWRPDAAAGLPATLAAARIGSDTRLFVLGPKTFGVIDPLSYVHLSHEERMTLRNAVVERPASHILRASLRPDVFIDVQRTICGAALNCPVFMIGERLISYDGAHLTRDGARYVGKLLFTQTALRELQPGH
jgi:peptidoglycan/LPS O-acetylase OafA/YrhL